MAVVLVVRRGPALPFILSVGDRNHGTDNASGAAAVPEAAALVSPTSVSECSSPMREELALAGARAWARSRTPVTALNATA
jgi:hypothetical protein